MMDEITKALTDQTATAAEYQHLAQQAGKRRAAAEARRRAIRPAGAINDPMLSGPGPERQHVLATGTVAQLAELDEQYRQLSQEVERLTVQERHLRRLYEEARAREAAETLPNEYKRLAESIAAVRAADAALAEAWAAADRQYQALAETRRWAARHARELPAADESVLAAVEAVRQCATGARRPRLLHAADVPETLGVEPEARWSAAL